MLFISHFFSLFECVHVKSCCEYSNIRRKFAIVAFTKRQYNVEFYSEHILSTNFLPFLHSTIYSLNNYHSYLLFISNVFHANAVFFFFTFFLFLQSETGSISSDIYFLSYSMLCTKHSSGSYHKSNSVTKSTQNIV